jgi:hypothetical protein
MFRVTRSIFDRLHDTLVSKYGLNSTIGMPSIESLGMFLWMLGGPQSISQVENRFERSIETISRKFTEMLEYVFKLGKHIIKPKDQQFTAIHLRLEDNRFSPHFYDCKGVVDDTHVHVIVPATEAVSHIGRHSYTSQNILTICDFNLWWPDGPVRRMTQECSMTLWRYGSTFPLHPFAIALRDPSLF